MHFIKLILVAIALELLGCFGLGSDEEKSISTEYETASEKTIIPRNTDKVVTQTDSIPERIIVFQI